VKLANVLWNGNTVLAVSTGTGVVPVPRLAERTGADGLPATTDDAVANPAALARLRSAVGSAGDIMDILAEPEDTVRFRPCLLRPEKILCIGLNYRRHAEETGSPIPTTPIVFSKFRNALAGHGDDIPIPAVTREVDYEAELALVIGRRAYRVGVEDALSYVFGYCTANDVSARDLQMRTSQWLMGKTLDRFAPIGPYLVTADEVPNPNSLAIRTEVNGEVRQNSNTADMIFSCAELVSHISQHFPLEPGDIILTGTPEGVILGYPPEQRRFLQPGDVVTVEVEGLGRLTNRIVAGE
jgi:2-keto-4-pentenoate hydratase/2-oxohepta-3-ene-1,7-dioic acid hydratase in catechol pathway